MKLQPLNISICLILKSAVSCGFWANTRWRCIDSVHEPREHAAFCLGVVD